MQTNRPMSRWFSICSEHEKEAAADAVLYRNTFGTQPRKPLGPWQNAFDLFLKNPANTNVVLWGDRLLALWEVTQHPSPRYSCLCLCSLNCMRLLIHICLHAPALVSFSDCLIAALYVIVWVPQTLLAHPQELLQVVAFHSMICAAYQGTYNAFYKG